MIDIIISMYFQLGIIITAIFIVMQYIFVLKYMWMAATIQYPKASELTIFGCKTWFFVADSDFDDDIAYNMFMNAFMIPIVGSGVLLLCWGPLAVVAIPTYLVLATRKKLFG